MSEFENFIGDSVVEATEVMGEDFVVNGQVVKGILDELEMSISGMGYGNTEEATSEVVFPRSSLKSKVWTGETILRKSEQVKYKIVSFDSDTKHYTFKLKRLGKQSRGE